MNVYGIIGWQNAGKTSLVERLVAYFSALGLRVSTVKHVHHDVDLDNPGKDTYRHREAGAHEVVMASAQRFAIMREHRGDEPDLKTILAQLAPVDLVLVEGYKRDLHPKVEVWRPACKELPLALGQGVGIRALASTHHPEGLAVPFLDLDNTQQIAEFITQDLGLVIPVLQAEVDYCATA